MTEFEFAAALPPSDGGRVKALEILARHYERFEADAFSQGWSCRVEY